MKPIRVLAFLEASTITGPAKNLLQFAQIAPWQPTPVQLEIATFRRAGDSTVFLDAAAQAGVTVHTLEERGAFDRSVIGSMKAIVDQSGPDIVQTHAVKSHLLLRLSGLQKRTPWIAFHHGYTWPTVRARAYNQLDRWSLRAARKVITVSIPFREELRRQGVEPSRISLLHNAIDTGWVEKAREESSGLRTRLGIEPGKGIVLIVGRLSQEKDHLTLLEALAAIHERGKIKPYLILVGEGPERPRIERKILDLALADSVRLTGQVPTAYPYYGIADVAVLSSLSEGSPNALLEAMAAGVPAVATRVGGIPEIVTHGESALLIEPGDRDGLAESIETVLVDKNMARSISQRARELIESRHTPGNRAAALAKIYQEVQIQPRSL